MPSNNNREGPSRSRRGRRRRNNAGPRQPDSMAPSGTGYHGSGGDGRNSEQHHSRNQVNSPVDRYGSSQDPRPSGQGRPPRPGNPADRHGSSQVPSPLGPGHPPRPGDQNQPQVIQPYMHSHPPRQQPLLRQFFPDLRSSPRRPVRVNSRRDRDGDAVMSDFSSISKRPSPRQPVRVNFRRDRDGDAVMRNLPSISNHPSEPKPHIQEPPEPNDVVILDIDAIEADRMTSLIQSMAQMSLTAAPTFPDFDGDTVMYGSPFLI